MDNERSVNPRERILHQSKYWDYYRNHDSDGLRRLPVNYVGNPKQLSLPFYSWSKP